MIKEIIRNLATAYKDDSEILSLIEDTLESFSEYVKIVNSLENTISIMRFKLEPHEYRERVEFLDRNRRICHNSVIAGVKILNRLSLQKDLPLFFTGNVEDRYEVGSFAGLIVHEIFKNRSK